MKIEFKHSFLKSIEKLKDAKLKQEFLKIIDAVEAAETILEVKNIKKLKGYTSYFRISIGNYRIGLKWVEEEKTIFFVTFGHRKEIYNIFP
jgi:mRNA interferase RelE/StbE